MYPRLFQEVQKQILTELPTMQENMSLADMTQLSVLFDVPVTPSATSQMIQSLQETYDQEIQEEPPASIRTDVNLGDQEEIGAMRRAGK